ncbi:hypothetical protein [Corallococcus macrosporus]|uniref:Putative lipoprotein n=1 Tax=Myxococcus fulvus (strain ATCC BAA-855 / HW-1) TaxID=483219 RepID=F8CNQ4_MYXFH|nr:hypothetical protein [Corallococcus macrosporus]AEI64071.1 putative lipoprotein [Corallococcus macrosporus]
MGQARRSIRAARPLPLALFLFLGVSACGTVEIPGDAVACAGLQCTAGTCFSNAGQPMCRCGPWERAADVACAVAAFKQPDDHGGSPDRATVLTLPMSPREGRIDEGQRESMRDTDLFAVIVETGGMYRFSCTRLTLVDCRVRLLDVGGAAHDMPGTVEGATVSWFPTLSAGTWYFEVSSARSHGRYTYELVALGVDDHGATSEDATVLEAGASASFPVRLSSPFDADMFAFGSRVGHGYRFICEQTEPSPFLRLTLQSSTGQLMDESLGASGEPLTVSLRATSERDWLVTLAADYGDFPVDVACRFEDLGPDEHGDTLGTATPMTPGVPVAVTLQSREDVDVFAFTGAAGHVYAVRTEGAGRWSAQVVDANGENVARTDTDLLRARVDAAGTYYLLLEGGAPWAHSFVLTLVDAGVDDHGDSPQTATLITPGTPVTGIFETPQDTDAVVFPAEARGIYLASYAPFADLSFNPRGAVGMLELGSGRHLFSAWNPAPVTMMFQPLNGADAFSLLLEQLAIDDFGDHSGTAVTLTLPASVSGVVQTAIDADVFTVALEAGRAYRLELETGALQVSLLAPGGALSHLRSGRFVADRSGVHVLTLAGASGLAQVPWRFTLQAE